VRITQFDVRELAREIAASLDQTETADPAGQARSQAVTNIAVHTERLLEGLDLGGHEEAERPVNRLFVRLSCDQQVAVVEAIIRVATTTKEHTSQLLACSLLDAAGRLDPLLIKIEDVEGLARSADESLRGSAAVLLWQWAESLPGHVPVPLLSRLTQPSTESWYVHAAAKQLLLRRAAARAIFDQMAASRDRDDQGYAVADLLEVAKIEPRAIPGDLVQKLARAPARPLAARAAELLRIAGGVDEDERRR
jgi:hypothetical protein